MFRSLLFIPGNNPSMIQNADVFLADGIIFDLEDSVDVYEKDNARNLVNNYLVEGSTFPSIIVLRVNPTDTEFFKNDIKFYQNARNKNYSNYNWSQNQKSQNKNCQNYSNNHSLFRTITSFHPNNKGFKFLL